MASHHLLRAYNRVWQLRVDTWSSIADVTKRFVRPERRFIERNRRR